MEIFNNDLTITFTNEADAQNAKTIAVNTIKAMSIPGYDDNVSELFADSLYLEDNDLVNEEYCLSSDDFMNVAATVVKAIAASLKTANFTFDCVSSDSYTESWVEGCFENGLLTINTTYFPSGYSEFLGCPECGEDVVRTEDYDPSKTYICPDCGEEVDLSNEAPVITKETFEIK